VSAKPIGYNNKAYPHDRSIAILSRIQQGPGIYWTQRTNRQSTVEIVR